MNVLIENLPGALVIDGVKYKINTDYRVALKIMLAYEDPELTIREKQMITLELLYKQIPENKISALTEAIKFLDCGETSDGGGEAAATRVYSFNKDAKYIYSAIKQTHGVDLLDLDYLHWWKFCYMFSDLSEDCFFTKLIYYRNQRARGKLTKEEREYCNRISNILDLPIVHTAQEQSEINEFMRLLEKNG